MKRSRPDSGRRDLAEGLRSRRDEIAQLVFDRIHAIEPPDRDGEPEYQEGLRSAVEAAIDYTIEAVEDDDRAVPVPGPLLNQASLAARIRIPQETMLRRYLSGHAALGDVVIEEAERRTVSPAVLRRVLRSQAARTDRVLEAISAVYVQAARALQPLSIDRRRAERVARLLDGDLIDPSGLDYEFDAWHLGIVATGPGAEQAIDRLCESFDRRLLNVSVDDLTRWAWLGGQRPFQPRETEGLKSLSLPGDTQLAFGEPADSLLGWRLSHRQARAALSVGMRTGEPVVRYSDVALVASIIRDDLLVASLRRLYVEPLERERNSGEALLKTLRAYFTSGRSVSSAAAALGIARQTVAKRLRAAEDHLGQPLDLRGTELEIALRLQEVSSAPTATFVKR